MVKITMDHSAMIFYHRHPVIQKLRKLEEKGDVHIYNAITLDRDLEQMSDADMKVYDRLLKIVLGKEQKDISLTEHGDLVLLVNHLRSKRNFFLTLEKDKYENLKKHRDLKIRFPDNKFLKEVEGMIK